jgi:hypothetical protein
MAESVAQRKDERPIVGWRVFLPLIGSSVGLIALVFLIVWLGSWQAVVVGYFFLYTIASAFVVLLNYLLVKGFVVHARREAMLRRGAIEYLRATATAGGRSAAIEGELSNLESIERDAASAEKMPSSLYTAFGALPLVGIVVTLYYLRALEKVPVGHERRWSAFVQQVSSAGTKLGLAPKLRSTATRRGDRFLPLAIATLLFPPSLVLWYNLLLKENVDGVLQLLA